MKYLIIFISFVVALAVAQTPNPSNPIPTNYPKGSLRRALHDGTIADVCHNFTDYPENLLYEPQNCKFPEDDEASKNFKLCYLGVWFNGDSHKEYCLDKELISFVSTPDQVVLVDKCSEKFLSKCCTATKETRKDACLDMMNCYIYCGLGCKDICPVGYTLDEEKKRSRH